MPATRPFRNCSATSGKNAAPLVRLVAQEPNAVYVTINLGEIYIADDIRGRSFGLDGTLSDVLAELRRSWRQENPI